MAELFNQAIIKNEQFTGHKVGNFTKKISAYADDTAAHISNQTDLEILLENIKDFELATGLKVNMSKTKIVPLGSWRNKLNSGNKDKIPIQVPFECLAQTKYLGAPVGPVRDLDKWWDKVVDNVKNHIKYWTQKGSSVIDRSLIVKTMLLSKVWYLASVIPMKTNIANEIEKVCFAYLWGSKYDKESDKMTRRPVKVSKAQARKQKYLGGLDFWSVEAKAKALKSAWIVKIINDPLSDLSKVIRGVTQIEMDRSGADMNPFSSSLHQDPGDMKCKTLEDLQRAWSKVVARKEPLLIGERVCVLDPDNESVSIIGSVTRMATDQITVRNESGVTRTVHRHMIALSGAEEWRRRLDSSWLGWEKIQYIFFEGKYISIKTLEEEDEEDEIHNGGFKRNQMTHNRRLYLAQLERSEETLPPPKVVKWIESDGINMIGAHKTLRLSIASSAVKGHQYLILQHAVPVNDRIHRDQLQTSELRKCPLCKSRRETIHHLYYECRISRAIKKIAWDAVRERRGLILIDDISPLYDMDPRIYGEDISGTTKSLELTFRQIVNHQIYKARNEVVYKNISPKQAIVARAAVLEFELTIRAKVNGLRSKLKSLSAHLIEGAEEPKSVLLLKLEIAELASFIDDEIESPAVVFSNAEKAELRRVNNVQEQIDHDAPWSEVAITVAKKRRKLLKNKKLRDILDEGDPVFDDARGGVTVGNMDEDIIMMDVEERGFSERPNTMPSRDLDDH